MRSPESCSRLLTGLLVALLASGCAEDTDDAGDAQPTDATVADALFVGCLEPNADGSCPRDGDPVSGLTKGTNDDGSACVKLTEVLFCNVNAGSTGGSEAWHDAQQDRYVLFGGSPCITEPQRERWTYVLDGHHEIWSVPSLPECAPE